MSGDGSVAGAGTAGDTGSHIGSRAGDVPGSGVPSSAVPSGGASAMGAPTSGGASALGAGVVDDGVVDGGVAGASVFDGGVGGASVVDDGVVDDGARLARRGAPDVSGSSTSLASADDHGASRRLAAEEAEEYVAPAVGPLDLSDLPGPFTPRQLARIDEALSLATEETGLLFSLYVGNLDPPTRAAAEKLADQLPAVPDDGAVLVVVSPGQRVLHIVTTGGAVRRLPNRVCALAALGMRAAFVGGDLTAGAVNGLRMLADAAGQHSGSHLPVPAPFHR